jgi:hypothetical protein
MTSLAPDTPATLADLEAHGEVAHHRDEEVPRSAWSEREGHVFVNGVGFVPGASGEKRVPYRLEAGPFTCQGCKRATYLRPEVALWRRYENALGRRMYWLALASDAPPRSRCDECLAAPPNS